MAVGRKSSFVQLVLYLSSGSVPVCLSRVAARTMLYRDDSDVNLLCGCGLVDGLSLGSSSSASW